ncbi:hypothetical protein KDC22_11760 [Paenibacillus tritici]|uniref:hypothetical protein n=1 Tax=Paenibacillus tritici TaxID=1873425 RepID=UPI001BA6A307|nr:hypothetical protein [Paenibacillus tritici]QUL57082.1 hypothetical protein KDC22_11760 [Paenibacillus tritici]
MQQPVKPPDRDGGTVQPQESGSNWFCGRRWGRKRDGTCGWPSRGLQQIIKLVDGLFLYTRLQNPEYELELRLVDVVEVLKRNLFTLH